MSHVEQLVLQAKTCFQTKDYETCMSLTDEVLRTDPGNTEASWLMKEAQRQWEDQRSVEQLEIYVENLKKEAMDLFDNEHYDQCLGMFRFLAELEPENHTLRDYVKLSQQMIVEAIGPTEPKANQAAIVSASSDTKESDALDLGSSEPEMDHSSSLPGFALSELDAGASEVEKPIRASTPGSQKVLDPEAISESIRQKIIQEYLALATPRHRDWSWNVWLIVALVLVISIGIASFWLLSSFPASRIEVRSTPERAVVFIDNIRVGETPFRQGIPPGTHALRLEKKGYQTHSRSIPIERAQAIMLELQLEKAKTAPASGVQPTLPSEPPVQTPDTLEVSQPVDSVPPTVQIAQSVIHHHMLGSCTGRLKIDGERISFWSPGNSRDGFTRKINQISSFSLDEKLLIEFRDKAYRFEALARDPKDNRQRLASFYEQIKLQKTPQQKTP
jgi:PEGA domain